jgi:Fe-S-cluster containining protein
VLLKEGLATLDSRVREEVGRRVDVLEPRRAVTCPLLDPATGACLVYDFRPVACRTYGFYVERDAGLFCSRIERHVDAGEWPGAVWGNAATVQAELDSFGELRDLRELWYS